MRTIKKLLGCFSRGELALCRSSLAGLRAHGNTEKPAAQKPLCFCAAGHFSANYSADFSVE